MLAPGPMRTSRASRPGRRSARLQLEALESRDLLTTLTLSSEGPLSKVFVGDDASFQVQVATPGYPGGQVYPGDTNPGDAGLFLRQQDGTVVGLNLADRTAASRTRAGSTDSKPLQPLMFTRTDPAGAIQTTLIADNSSDGNTQHNYFQVVEVVTYHPGESDFRVDTMIVNLGSSTLTLDAFLGADLFLAGSDFGVGYYDATSGAVGGMTVSGTGRAFVQPNPTGGPDASSYQAGNYQNIWAAIGYGATLDKSVNLPGGGAPYGDDPSSVDNGAALEWHALTIPSQQVARFSAFWSFGPSGPVKTEPAPSGSPLDFSTTPGQSEPQPIAQFTLPDGAGRPAGYQALIVWGDGSQPEYGKIQPQGSGYVVVGKGTHAYAAPGQYPVSISIVGPGGGAVVVHATGNVNGSPTLSGGLSAASDHGISSSDGITNYNTPTFVGQGTPGGTVQLLAQPVGSSHGGPIALGSTTVNAAGSWSLTTGTVLPDGVYTVSGTIDAAGAQGGATLMTASHPLVIDTQAPCLMGLTANIRSGKIVLTASDKGSGLDLRSGVNWPMSQIVLATPQALRTLKVRPKLQSGATASLAKVVIQTKPATSLGKIFALEVAFTLRDRAGNVLDGTYRGAFATGGGQPGTPFRVLVRTNGSQVVSILPWNGDLSALSTKHKPRH